MQLVIISGPPGAGKTATVDALCDRYDRMLHVEMAKLRDLLRMGRLRPWDASDEGRTQLQLFISAACDLSLTFLRAGYGVVIDDVITPEELVLYAERLRGFEPAHFIVLLPDLDVVLQRAGVAPRQEERIRKLHRAFQHWHDVATVRPDDLGPELVADRVMSLAAEGKALLANVNTAAPASGA